VRRALRANQEAVQDPFAVQAILAHLARSGAPAPTGPTGSPRLSPSLDAAPDTRQRPPRARSRTPHPLLDREPVAAQDGSGSEGDRGADPRLRPGKASSPGVRLGGVRRGRPHSTHPGRTPREQRLSVLSASRRGASSSVGRTDRSS
jgi:hypothetical protein